MKYKDMDTKDKRTINGTLFSQFSSGCLDFKGEEEAFSKWFKLIFIEMKTVMVITSVQLEINIKKFCT